MEYMTILCVRYKDDTATKKAIYTAESSDAAVKGVYTNMGMYMAADNVESVMAMAVNSIGGVYKNEHWTAPVDAESDLCV